LAEERILAPQDIDKPGEGDITQLAVGPAFRQVRRRAVVFGALPCGLGLSFAFLTAVASVRDFIGISQLTGFYIGFGTFLLGWAACALIYRCPACGSPIWRATAVNGLSFDLSAPRCRRCGANFE